MRGVTVQRWPVLEMVMLTLGLLFVSPCLLALVNSFKPLREIIQSPLALPESFTVTSYLHLWNAIGERSLFGRLTGVPLAGPMLNSLLMCAAVILSLIATAPMAAYSLVRRRMATGKVLTIAFLAGLTIPFQIIMVPLLQQFRLMHIQFTYFALLIHYVSWGLPLCIFIYSGFMTTIPKELEESAAIDGCGPVSTFWRIVFPLLTPCTVTIIIFWGLWIWNDFMQAFIIMGPSRGQLVFVQLWRFLSDKYVKNWNHIFAGVVVFSAPVTVLYLAMQRRFIKGLTAGAVK
jgi:raffinose/stachyose/melibiose transport system permease protein